MKMFLHHVVHDEEVVVILKIVALGEPCGLCP